MKAFLILIILSFSELTLANTNESCFIADGNTIIDFICGDEKYVTIPQTINGIKIENIGDSAFEADWDNNLVLFDVVIPNGIKKIGNKAFYKNILHKIVIPNTVTSIGFAAFASTSLLDKIVIPDSVVEIGPSAFFDNFIEEVILPKHIEALNESVFAFNRLKEIDIPNSVKIIKAKAFFENALASIYIPDSVHAIEHRAFSYQNAIGMVASVPRHTVIDDTAFVFGTVKRRP